MTWAAWRVQRAPGVALAAGVSLFAAWLVATALSMGHDPTWKYWTDGDTYALYAVPGVLGLALGAPLVAGELSYGTNRVAWSQSVSRNRWLTSKLAVGAVITVVVSGALALVLQWWTSAISLSPLTNSGGFTGVRVQPSTFDVTGIVVVAYALFAFALGSALGAWLRRPGWAFAFGVPLFAFARLAIEDWVRPGLVAPAELVSDTQFFPRLIPNAWLLHVGELPLGETVPRAGQGWSTSLPAAVQACLGSKGTTTAQSAASCAHSAGFHLVEQFQPASHYWLLQFAESGIFLAFAAALVVLTTLAVRAWQA